MNEPRVLVITLHPNPRGTVSLVWFANLMAECEMLGKIDLVPVSPGYGIQAMTRVFHERAEPKNGRRFTKFIVVPFTPVALLEQHCTIKGTKCQFT